MHSLAMAHGLLKQRSSTAPSSSMVQPERLTSTIAGEKMRGMQSDGQSESTRVERLGERAHAWSICLERRG